jgi:protein ImuB
MIVCVHLPRFALTVAAGGPAALAGRALAIAPAASGAQRVGEVSGTAQAAGVSAGMGLGEALARCPTLTLVPEDPVGVAHSWERALRALEGIGAALEAPRPGVVFFDADGLLRLYHSPGGVIAASRDALERPSRIGSGPTRFCALAAAMTSRSRRARIVEDRDARRYLAAQPVGLLAYRPETIALVGALERLGLDTLGALARLGPAQIADRFGTPGTIARQLALGYDQPLRTRSVEDQLRESMTLGEVNSGEALSRTLGVLVDRLIARPERRGRTFRAIVLSARLVERGTWSERVVFREALGDRTRIRLALAARLPLLPAPAEALALTVQSFGPAGGEQTSLLDSERSARIKRLSDAVAQVRTVAGHDAALRALLIDPDSRVPERRYVFSPFAP